MTFVDIERTSSLPLARSKSRPAVRKTVRQQRLERLAGILESHDSTIPLLTRIEYAPWHERPYLREDRSPLWLAFQDEGFRREFAPLPKWIRAKLCALCADRRCCNFRLSDFQINVG